MPIVRVADRHGAWIVADEIYRGAELEGDDDDADLLGSLRTRRRDQRPVEGVRDAGSASRLGGRAAATRSGASGSGTTTRR